MRCPGCSRAIPEDAVVHDVCGWAARAPDPVPQRQRDAVEEQRQADAEARGREFMQRHGLKTQADCAAFLNRRMRTLVQKSRGETVFAKNCRTMKQSGIDWLVNSDDRQSKRVLRRLREAAVVDEQNRLIPIADRPAVLEALRLERERVAAELVAQRQQIEQQMQEQALEPPA